MIDLSLAPAVNTWLKDSRHPRILHIFDSACNLINESREVLSIVTPQIGRGNFRRTPFIPLDGTGSPSPIIPDTNRAWLWKAVPIPKRTNKKQPRT
jgi:hypothetical protein